MSQTRREFLAASTAALSIAAAYAVHGEVGPAASDPARCDCEPAWIVGDPYTASACHVGFDSRSFDAARARALRFRMPEHERDRLLLGLDS